jgi:hypothetical protein
MNENIVHIDPNDCGKIMVTKRNSSVSAIRFNNEDVIFSTPAGEFEGSFISNIEYNVYIDGVLGVRQVATQLFNKYDKDSDDA